MSCVCEVVFQYFTTCQCGLKYLPNIFLVFIHLVHISRGILMLTTAPPVMCYHRNILITASQYLLHESPAVFLFFHCQNSNLYIFVAG